MDAIKSAWVEEALCTLRLALEVHTLGCDRYRDDHALHATTRATVEAARARLAEAQGRTAKARVYAAGPQLLQAVKVAIDWHCSRIGTEAGAMEALWEAYKAAVDVYAPMAGGERCCCDVAPGAGGSSASGGATGGAGA